MDEQTPFYQHHIFTCTNTRPPDKRRSCGLHGSEALRDYLKEQVKARDIPSTRVQTTACMNRCEFGPVMVVYPEGTWYGYHTEADVDEIVQSHLLGGKPVERLMLGPEQK
jgi:(2Fe-2S) ferredoxin